MLLMRNPNTIPAEIDSLLSEGIPTAMDRERYAFDLASVPFGQKVVVHGAGRFGRLILSGLRQRGIEPIAFTDNNPLLYGESVEGVRVISPHEGAEKFGRSAAFVVAVWNGTASDRMGDRIAQLTELGCERVVPAGLLCWKYPDVFLPYYPLDLPHKALLDKNRARAAFKLFADDASRAEYLAQMRFRLHLDYDSFTSPLPHDGYFQSDLYDLQPDEVLIDCGAYDGDSIESFVRARNEQFEKIIAFEPDPGNWTNLKKRLSKFQTSVAGRVTPLPYALGSMPGTVQFDSTGTETARIGKGPVTVRCVVLDDVLRDARPTFMKFDIEGAELDALNGARQVIISHRPIMVVSCYHQQSHLWEVPLLLADLCRDYRFFLRPHGAEGWDLLTYAVPVERLRLETGVMGASRL
jgi:FkbM family methyltransferase